MTLLDCGLPDVEVRVARSEDVLRGRSVTGLRARLSAPERARLDAFHRQESARDFLAARVLARRVAAAAAGVAEAEVILGQMCPRCSAPGHGRPHVEGHDIGLSWSHSGGHVAAAVSTRRHVGVDVEPRDRTTATAGFADSAFPETEVVRIRASEDPRGDSLRLWTVKEAVVKLGAGLSTMVSVPLEELAAEVGAEAWWSGESGDCFVGVAVART